MVIHVKFHGPCCMEESKYTDIWHESMIWLPLGEILLVGFELIAHLLEKLYICFCYFIAVYYIVITFISPVSYNETPIILHSGIILTMILIGNDITVFGVE